MLYGGPKLLSVLVSFANAWTLVQSSTLTFVSDSMASNTRLLSPEGTGSVNDRNPVTPAGLPLTTPHRKAPTLHRPFSGDSTVRYVELSGRVVWEARLGSAALLSLALHPSYGYATPLVRTSPLQHSLHYCHFNPATHKAVTLWGGTWSWWKC